jgi:aryl-alcohol dehydrogenase-like predicted oxidoreductase
MALKYRSLGRTRVQVSELCFGAMNFADGTDDSEAERIISRLQEVGGNFIDTANVYAAGKSEEMLGRVLKKLGNRDWFVVATKGHGRMGDGPNDYGNSRLHLTKACEDSLRRLQTDHIDLYQIHRPDPAIPIDETLAALDSLVTAGKVRYVGASTFPAWAIVESLWASKELHYARFISDQPPYNLLDRRLERELLPMAQTFGLAVLPWGPLAGGMLSGKYRRNSPAPEGSRYTNDRYRGAPIKEPVWQVLEGLEKIAQRKNGTLSQLSLAWVLSRPGVTSPIIGVRTLEQLEDNLKAVEITLTEEDSAAVDALIPPGTFVKDYYGVNPAATARW